LQYFRGYKTIPQPLEGAVVAVGNFDGVHIGHQEVLRRVRAKAKELSVRSVVFTFRPHPLKFLIPDKAPSLISTYEQKREYLKSLEMDILIEEPFTKEFASLPAESFVSDILHDTLQTKYVFAGIDFTFGKGGKADVEHLGRLAAPYGMEVSVVEPQKMDDIRASSTRIRQAVVEGQVSLAHFLLGRPFVLSGLVTKGEARGRQMGFPTANLDVEQELLPPYGVYACWAEVQGKRHPAVVNIGMRPTFGALSPTVEAHLLDFSGDLYDQSLTLFFVERLREERQFPNINALIDQIKTDILKAKGVLQSPN